MHRTASVYPPQTRGHSTHLLCGEVYPQYPAVTGMQYGLEELQPPPPAKQHRKIAGDATKAPKFYLGKSELKASVQCQLIYDDGSVVTEAAVELQIY